MQTIFGVKTKNGERIYGNCKQASVASIFDLPLDCVPHFLAFGDQWDHAFNLWLKSRSVKYNQYLIEWLKDDTVKLDTIPMDQYVLATGLAARGFMHCCIFQRKDDWFIPIHDPHPDGTFFGDNPIKLVQWFFSSTD